MSKDHNIKHFLTYNKKGEEAFLCNTSLTSKEKMTDIFKEVNCINCQKILGTLLK